MSDIKTILASTDFSDCSQYAVDYAVALAKALDAELHLTHVVDTGYIAYAAMYGQSVVVDPNIESVEAAAADSLEQSVEAIQAGGVKAIGHLEKGTPVTVLLGCAKSVEADLVVIGTHGYTGFNKFLFGSTCERLVRESTVPVLAIKQPEKDATFDAEAFEIDRIMATTDLSDFSRVALVPAAALCRAFDAELELLHVIDTRYESFPHLAAVDQPEHAVIEAHAEQALKEIAGELEGISVSTKVVDGVPHHRVEQEIVDSNVDMLIMATHGHGAVLHALLGSTAEKVVRLAQCPVMTVRPKG